MNRLEILQDIASFSNKNNINPEKIILITVSKNAGVLDIYDLYNQGQRHFAENIIQNANLYINQFKDNKSEDWLSLKVLEKYFKLSNQI